MTTGSSSVLGVRISHVTMDELVEGAIAAACDRRNVNIMYANVHVLNTAYRNDGLRTILNDADTVYCDGEGVRLGARMLGSRIPQRMTGADWIGPLCNACARADVAIAFIGGAEGVAVKAAAVLTAAHPGLRVVSTHHGYLGDEQAARAAVAEVNAAEPGVLLVGMGTPMQELWIASHRNDLKVPVVWAVGALLDFVTGVQPRAPRWMCANGLEWLYRFMSSPARLWKRYLAGNPLFVWRLLGQAVKS